MDACDGLIFVSRQFGPWVALRSTSMWLLKFHPGLSWGLRDGDLVLIWDWCGENSRSSYCRSFFGHFEKTWDSDCLVWFRWIWYVALCFISREYFWMDFGDDLSLLRNLRQACFSVLGNIEPQAAKLVGFLEKEHPVMIVWISWCICVSLAAKCCLKFQTCIFRVHGWSWWMSHEMRSFMMKKQDEEVVVM